MDTGDRVYILIKKDVNNAYMQSLWMHKSDPSVAVAK